MLSRPSARDWRETFLAFGMFSLLAVPFSIATNLFEINLAQDPVAVLKIVGVALILPALLEEILFRGPVVWAAQRGKYVVPISVATLALFILWHPLNGMFLMTDARSLFTDWRFLCLAGLLGAFAARLAIKTRSIWPPVIFHWLCVVGWKVFLGGPQFLG